jgi:photosystem II stability/assembly factor-like uncharacterized protein
MNPSCIRIAVLILGMVAGGRTGFSQGWGKTSAPNYRWWSVASSADGSKLAALHGYSDIFTSSDAGKTWVSHTVAVGWCEAVAMSADGKKLVVVCWKGGPIYTSKDSGETWEKTSAPNAYWGSVASSADGSKLLAAGSSLYRSENSGETWEKVGPTNYLSEVASSADGMKLFATTRDGVFTSGDGGSSWEKSSGVTNWCTAIACSADGSKVAMIELRSNDVYSRVLHSNDSGRTWIRSGLEDPPFWSSVASSADGSRLVVVGQDGSVYTSEDYGVSWRSNLAAGLNVEQWQTVASSADGKRFVAGSAANSSGAIWTFGSVSRPELKLGSGSNLHLSWIIPTSEFVLEESDSLNSADWKEVASPAVLNGSTLEEEVDLSGGGTKGFYRLKKRGL